MKPVTESTNVQADDTDGPYTITSCKGQRTHADLSLDDVISAAKMHDEEYQPAFGTTVENARGETVWSSEDELADLVSMSDINHIAINYGVRWTLGSSGETVADRALSRAQAGQLVDALVGAGHQASDAMDPENGSLWWVYVTEMIRGR